MAATPREEFQAVFALAARVGCVPVVPVEDERGVAEGGTDPLDRILAYDYIALSWLDKGDLEAAAGVLNQCLRALSPMALEESRSGERVRNSLLRMRVVESLQRRVRERLGSSPDSGTPRKS